MLVEQATLIIIKQNYISLTHLYHPLPVTYLGYFMSWHPPQLGVQQKMLHACEQGAEGVKLGAVAEVLMYRDNVC